MNSIFCCSATYIIEDNHGDCLPSGSWNGINGLLQSGFADFGSHQSSYSQFDANCEIPAKMAPSTFEFVNYIATETPFDNNEKRIDIMNSLSAIHFDALLVYLLLFVAIYSLLAMKKLVLVKFRIKTQKQMKIIDSHLIWDLITTTCAQHGPKATTVSYFRTVFFLYTISILNLYVMFSIFMSADLVVIEKPFYIDNFEHLINSNLTPMFTRSYPMWREFKVIRTCLCN